MLKGMGLNMSKFLNDEQMKKLENKHPLGFGKSKDLFYLLEYLVDNERSRWITGSNITLDGGLSI
jgi:NAD(P)-dependent dehydrogenase (short-subunit alcohol dehydrogenase family)